METSSHAATAPASRPHSTSSAQNSSPNLSSRPSSSPNTHTNGVKIENDSTQASRAVLGLTEEEFVAEEKKVVRKLDLYMIPLIMLLYLFSFLDRVNIGNARLYKLEEDLQLTSSQFQISVSIFFVTYLLFEVPSNLVLQYFTPQRYIAAIAILWGIIAAASSQIQSYTGLIISRLFLGVVEAGLFPGLNVYLTLFYTRSELALRVGYLFVSAAIAGAVGGLLAYGIGHLDGHNGWSGWRWIFLLEGVPSIALGIAVYFVLPNNAPTAWFLSSPTERAVVERRRLRDYGQTKSAQTQSKEDALKAITDWRVWVFSIAQFGVDTMLYGYSTFLPTIIAGIGTWTNAEVQLLTIPCYFLGALLYMLVARLSDRMQQRGLFCLLFGTVSVVGYAVLLSPVSSAAHYFGCFLVAAGLYIVVGLPLAWLPNNSPRYGKRTMSTGLQLTFGNIAGVLMAFIYPASDKPRYVRGHAISLGMVGMGVILYGVLLYSYRRENRRRAEGHVPEKQQGLSESELEELGDESHKFRYVL